MHEKLLVLRPAVLQLRSAQAPTPSVAFPARKCRFVREPHTPPELESCTAAHPPMNHRRDKRNLEYHEKPATAAEVAECLPLWWSMGLSGARVWEQISIGLLRDLLRKSQLEGVDSGIEQKEIWMSGDCYTLIGSCWVASASAPGHSYSGVAIARRSPLLRPPFHAQPRQIAQLNDPCNHISGNREVMVENRCLVHVFPFLRLAPGQASSAACASAAAIFCCCRSTW